LQGAADLNVGAGLCGSGLAREEGVSVTYALTDTPLSRASPLPHKPAPTLVSAGFKLFIL